MDPNDVRSAAERVLITGAAGLVGSRLVSRFQREGVAVRALDRRPLDFTGAECVVADVTDSGAMERAVAETTLVAHCAAVISGAPDEEMMRINVEGTRVLLEAARGAGCRRFLYVSSAMVYAFDDRPVVDESTPFRSDGPAFHLSRVRAEEVVWAASGRGLPVTVFRPYAILGAHPTSTSSVLLAEQIARGEFIMRGDGSGSLPYVHVDSLVEAVVTAARRARAAGQAYNIVDGHTTGRTYIDRLCQCLGVPPLPARGELVPWRGHFSGAKAARELGYTPQRTYEDAMLETGRYLLDRGIIRR